MLLLLKTGASLTGVTFTVLVAEALLIPVGSITENNIALASVSGLKVIGKDGKYVVVEVGSGKYHFTSPIQ